MRQTALQVTTPELMQVLRPHMQGTPFFVRALHYGNSDDVRVVVEFSDHHRENWRVNPLIHFAERI